MNFKFTYRGKTWNAEAIAVAPSQFTAQITLTTHVMPLSVLEFSLWDARCAQIPDLVLDTDTIELLRPWLRKKGTPWKLGWTKKTTMTRRKTAVSDPRQGKLF